MLSKYLENSPSYGIVYKFLEKRSSLLHLKHFYGGGGGGRPPGPPGFATVLDNYNNTIDLLTFFYKEDFIKKKTPH